MNINIDKRIAAGQSYSCLNCGHGCRSFMVPVTAAEQRKIMALENWFETLAVDTLFVDISAPGFKDGALAKRPDSSCVFLDSDNLCTIHRKYGLAAKPAACQLFPFVLTPFKDGLRVGLRFDCAGVCRGKASSKQALDQQCNEIKRISQIIYPNDLSKKQFETALPAVSGKQKTTPENFEKINSTIIDIFQKAELSWQKKLLWLAMFAGHLEKVKWSAVGKDDFAGLLSLLSEGTVREIAKLELKATRPTAKTRVLFGQILYLLAHSPEIITSERKGLLHNLKQRLHDAADIRQFGRIKGPVPRLWPDWPVLDLSEMEAPLRMPESGQELLERYALCRLAGMNYCGPNYYRYNMVDGLYCLVLALCGINWLARLNARSARRSSLSYEDVETALIIADSNNGYGTALNAGAASLRLKYLKDNIPSLIYTYIDK